MDLNFVSDKRHYCADDFIGMDQRFRTQLINSMPGIKSVNLVGTKSEDGFENLAIFNSVFHVGANPPFLGMVIRPDSVDRHTWNNIQKTGCYSLNQVSTNYASAAHQTSARYSKEQSEFAEAGFTVEYQEGFFAPFVGESIVSIGLKYEEHYRVKANNTLVVIGKIEHLVVQEGLISEDGFVNLAQGNVLSCIGLDAYCTTALINRFAYAKPDLPPREI
jgi:flavin reductase (DIM6/NTAB) family NADH-FMN oxidoreductase RutF